MRKLISLGLIIAIIFIPGTMLSFVKSGVRSLADNISKTNYTVLVCGFDDAAYNTDSIILLNFDSELNSLSFLQIPRDTYFDFSEGQNKVNGYIPELISEGVDLSDAMDRFTGEISSSLGVKIDGYVGLTMQAVADLVDCVGGIDVNIPVSMQGVDLNGDTVKLTKGKNHLSGAESVVFLRYRKGYALGDLSRLDAQKIFLSSLASSLKRDVSMRKIIKLLLKKNNGIVTDIGIVDMLGLSSKSMKDIKNVSMSFSEMAGGHLLSVDGVSYFCINKNASEELIVHLPFYRISSFDSDEQFLNKKDGSFSELYYKSGIKYKIYTEDELDRLDFILN